MEKVAFLFPGQASQYVGMGKDLYENYKSAKEVFNQAEDILGFRLKKICFEGPLNELTKTENAQPAILTTSIAAYKVFMEELGLEPAYCAGHSLGEFTALTVAGAMRFEDAVRIVRQRGKFMQEAVPIEVGAMAAVQNCSEKVIEEICEEYTNDKEIAVVSNYNAPDQLVISGHKDAINSVIKELKGNNIKAFKLNVSAPFHSPLMKPAIEKFKEELNKYTYKDLKYPVISNVTATPYISKDSIIENLTLQIVKPVKWNTSIEYIKNQNVKFAIELGPKTVLRNLVKKITGDVIAYSFDNEEDLRAIKKEFLQPLSFTNIKKLDLVTRALSIAVCTKNNNFNNNEYQEGVINPYNKVKKIKEKFENESRKPSMEEMTEALEMLKSVFNTKKTSIEEQRQRFEELFRKTGTENSFSNFEI